MAKEKVYIRRNAKGYAYFAGDIHEMDAKQAKELYDKEIARPATEVLPKDIPARTKLLKLGFETVEELKELKNLQRLRLDYKEKSALAEYLAGGLPDDLPGKEAFEKAGITSVDEIKELEDPTKVKGIGDATAKELAEYLAG